MLLGQMSDVFEASRRYMQRSGSLAENWYLIVAAVAIGALWGVLYVWDRYLKTAAPRRTDPRSLFEELCHRHHLDRTRRALLWRAAQRRHAEQPALAFVDPAILSDHAAATDRDAAACADLLKTLFGDPAA